MPKNKRVIGALKTVGLTELEAQIYLYVLHHGPCGATKVYKGLEHDKSSTYRVLDELVEDGLLETLGDGYGQKYKVSNPNFVLELARSQREELSQAERDIFDLVRNLEGPTVDAYKQRNIRVYEGIRGVKETWERQLYSKDKIVREIGTTAILAALFDDYQAFMASHAEKRVRENIFLRSLVSGLDLDPVIDQSSAETMKEVRFLPQGFTLQAAVTIYGDVVSFHYPRGDQVRGVLIEDEIISNLVKSLFDQIWQIS